MEPKKKRLSEEELKRWWPFERLDPDRMPAPPKKKPQPNPDWEEALL
jgi:hypothetical protein